ncbi:hypothetical protein CSUI_007821 [Cystoisospora suis]|uniref:Transmembrane protein n=1 Tax=Cystoisospora suis TaxID=483139 RepID=A0A2C6KPN5_9APIC|nr:hypothetical protein CSUI_007821 [Cystoisospora suis]
MAPVRRDNCPCWTNAGWAWRDSRRAPARCSTSASAPADVSIPGALNMSDIYSRLLINSSLRTLGAMVVSAVPALVLFRGAGPRMFFVGAAGGLVGGWQLHSADRILKDPVKHRDLIPKAATVAECTEDIQRELREAVSARSSFGTLSKGLSWVKDTLRFSGSSAPSESSLGSVDEKSSGK